MQVANIFFSYTCHSLNFKSHVNGDFNFPGENLIWEKVRMEGLEPPHLTASDPKSDVSTNFTTCAFGAAKVNDLGQKMIGMRDFNFLVYWLSRFFDSLE